MPGPNKSTAPDLHGASSSTKPDSSHSDIAGLQAKQRPRSRTGSMVHKQHILPRVSSCSPRLIHSHSQSQDGLCLLNISKIGIISPTLWARAQASYIFNKKHGYISSEGGRTLLIKCAIFLIEKYFINNRLIDADIIAFSLITLANIKDMKDELIFPYTYLMLRKFEKLVKTKIYNEKNFLVKIRIISARVIFLNENITKALMKTCKDETSNKIKFISISKDADQNIAAYCEELIGIKWLEKFNDIASVFFGRDEDSSVLDDKIDKDILERTLTIISHLIDQGTELRMVSQLQIKKKILSNYLSFMPKEVILTEHAPLSPVEALVVSAASGSNMFQNPHSYAGPLLAETVETVPTQVSVEEQLLVASELSSSTPVQRERDRRAFDAGPSLQLQALVEIPDGYFNQGSPRSLFSPRWEDTTSTVSTKLLPLAPKTSISTSSIAASSAPVSLLFTPGQRGDDSELNSQAAQEATCQR